MSKLRTLLRTLLNKLKLSDAKNERGSARNGLFSYSGEVHAFLLGFAAGSASATLDDPRIAGGALALSLGFSGYESAINKFKKSGKEYNQEEAIREMSTEPWYTCGGVVVGYIAGYATKSA